MERLRSENRALTRVVSKLTAAATAATPKNITSSNSTSSSALGRTRTSTTNPTSALHPSSSASSFSSYTSPYNYTTTTSRRNMSWTARDPPIWRACACVERSSCRWFRFFFFSDFPNWTWKFGERFFWIFVPSSILDAKRFRVRFVFVSFCSCFVLNLVCSSFLPVRIVVFYVCSRNFCRAELIIPNCCGLSPNFHRNFFVS